MENTEITYIDKLPVERWEEFKNLKIEGLTTDPSAFTQTLSDVKNSPDTDWKMPLGKALKGENAIIFAEYKGKLIGIGGVHLFSREKVKHNASLESLYVSPEYRRKGIAKEIVKRELEFLAKSPEIKMAFAEIFSSQTASLVLHKELGFEVVGTIKDFMQWEGKYYDSVFVQKKIRDL
jgi:L-amino acid N-acyltransferase YncA